jgi:hypothetical protein
LTLPFLCGQLKWIQLESPHEEITMNENGKAGCGCLILLSVLIGLPLSACCLMTCGGMLVQSQMTDEQKKIIEPLAKKMLEPKADQVKADPKIDEATGAIDGKGKVLVKGHWQNGKWVEPYERNAKGNGPSKGKR